MYNIYLTGTALVIAILISIIMYSKNATNSETRIYKKMLLCNIIESLTTTLIVIVALTINSELVFKILNRVDIIAIITWTSLMFYYVYTITVNKPNKNVKKIVIFLNVIMYIAALFLNVEIINHNGILDSTGPLTYLGLFGAGSYIVLIILVLAFTTDKKESLDANKYIPLYILIVLMIVLAALRITVPQINFISIILSFVDLLMIFTMENSDAKMIEQLEIAREQADKANDAKTEFLSSMSHEIRTPLNAIVGFSDYIMTSDSLEEVKDNAKNILEASNTLLEIVNGILDISKIEAGKLEIINSKYNARDVYGSIYKLIAPKMKEKGLEFDYYIASDVPDTLYGDHANIKKVITEIINNAYKYTDMGFVRYKVNCKNNGDISQLIITVEDSGRGIRHENVNKIFNKFERLEQDRNTTIEGTGLGLSLTKQLVSLMGGEVLVDTTFGAGTKFTIILNQKIETTPVEQPKEIITTLDLTDKNILIVDDNMLNIKVTKKLLERYNATNIIYTTNGYDCVEKIKRGAVFDIIFLDDMMPKISGIETFKLLKQIPNFNQPVIIFTANAIAGMREKYLSEGFTDYLAKPIEKDELIRVCSSIIYKDGVPASLATPVQKVAQVQPITPVEPTTTAQQISEIELIQPITPITPPAPQQTEELEIIGAEEPSSTKEEYLKNNGVALDKALELLGDIEMYNMTIGDFLSEVEEKWQNIINYKNINDMKNYAIEVHSLKSDAKYLGFMSLADIAYQHELKSKEENIAFVNEHFNELQIEYSKALEIAKNYNKMIN